MSNAVNKVSIYKIRKRPPVSFICLCVQCVTVEAAPNKLGLIKLFWIWIYFEFEDTTFSHHVAVQSRSANVKQNTHTHLAAWIGNALWNLQLTQKMKKKGEIKPLISSERSGEVRTKYAKHLSGNFRYFSMLCNSTFSTSRWQMMYFYFAKNELEP